jgi:hypothetical protein
MLLMATMLMVMPAVGVLTGMAAQPDYSCVCRRRRFVFEKSTGWLVVGSLC